jgi:hypothetical protein
MDKIIRIKIDHTKMPNEYLHPREAFWSYFQKIHREALREAEIRRESDRSIESYEKAIEENLGRKETKSLIVFFSRGINAVEFRRDLNSRNSSYIQDAGNLYRDQPPYIDAVNKTIQASQIIFKVKNFNYSSLGIDVIVEPFDKLFDLFDDNFDLMRLFFESYIPSAFSQTIADNPYADKYNDIPLSFRYEFPANVRQTASQLQYFQVPNTHHPSASNKIDRTKWLTGLITQPHAFSFHFSSRSFVLHP